MCTGRPVPSVDAGTVTLNVTVMLRRSASWETSVELAERFCPEGRAGLHAFSNPTGEPARILAMSAGGFPDVVAYPEDRYAWVATRDPDPELLARGGDPGIIARFEIPIE